MRPVQAMTTLANDAAAPTLMHDRAAAFLALLAQAAKEFTFQLFGDGADRPAMMRHGTRYEVWPIVQAANTPARRMGVFVTSARVRTRGPK
jgi:hypothetical protein